MAENPIKITMSGSRAVISGLDSLGATLPESLARGMGRIGTVLRHRMSAYLFSGAALGRRTGTAANSVISKVGKDKRGVVSLMVFPRVPYAWMNAYGFPKALIHVGGQRMALSSKTGEVRALGPRKKLRKKEMQVWEGGYDRLHVLKPRPFAPQVLAASGDLVEVEIAQSVNAATRGARLGS